MDTDNNRSTSFSEKKNMAPRATENSDTTSRSTMEESRAFSSVELIDDTSLSPPRTRLPLVAYSKAVWRRRHFIYAEARSKALSSGRGMFLGKVWIVLDPLLQVVVYAVIFGLVLNVSRGMDNFVGFLILGVIFFGFLSRGISAGSGLIQSSRNMIASFNFPRASLAISANLRNLIDNLAPAVVAVVLAIFSQLDEPIHWTVIFIIPIFLMIHIFTLGTTLVIARVTAFIPDAKSLVVLLQRALFFVSGVFFTVERFDTHPYLQLLVEANPLYQFLMAVRDCVLVGDVPSVEVWLYLSAWTFGLFFLGMVFFGRAEERYSSVK